MTEDQVRDLTKFGVDTEDPIEVQRDFQFVRDMRNTTESIKGKTVIAMTGTIVVGLLAVLWIGIKALLTN